MRNLILTYLKIIDLHVVLHEVDMTLLDQLNLSAQLVGATGIIDYSASGTSFESFNPTNAESIAVISTATQEDLKSLVCKSQQAFLACQNVPAPKRGDIIREIAVLLRAHKSELGSLISLEMGKSKQEGDGEVQEMIDMADLAVGQSRMLYGKTMHSERAHHRLYEQWHPLGVVGIITAFNFPMAVWAWNAFLAIVCGNSVIWKPSSKTPLGALAVHRLCQQVMQQHQLPEIFTVVIPDNHQTAEQLLLDSRIALISFTGSTAVGKTVAVKVAQRFGRCLLELGGNNAVIVDESANLDMAVSAITFAAVGTAGQRCTTTRRVIAHKNVYDLVKKGLLEAYAQIKIGDPKDPGNHMGPLIDQAAVDLYSNVIAQINQSGGRILRGGHIIKRPGYFVEPTIVEGLDFKHPLLNQEHFVPVLYLLSATDLKQAITLQNSVPQGLSSALFTNRLQHAEYFLSCNGSDCGIANINIGTSGAEITGAFGGEKETGGGREAGSDAWKTYMRRQTNTINWGADMPLAQGIQFKLS